MQKALSLSIKLSLCTLAYICVTSDISLAQVTPDGTTSTTVNPDGDNFTIENGDRAGGNLFHSFDQFSVPNGGSAVFNNATDISNIFSRVTGGSISNIDGLIKANGSASLFLINPAGIIFGEGARLDIGGSFYGSSATSILFEDGEFSAADLDNPPLLTVNAPIGLGFRDEPGDIVNRSVADDLGLQILSGQNISLLGGNINIAGGKITAPGGVINLGGLSTAGTITLESDGNFSFPNDVAKANVFLTDNAVVDITSGGGGLITVNANNLELTGESLLLANIGEGLGSEDAVAGTIEINTTSIFADNNSLIHSDNLGIGQAGTINITTGSLNLASGSAITATTFGVGDAGTINVTAQNIALDQEFTGIYSNVGLTRIASDEQDVNGVVGNAGTINIDTDTLSLTNGARIITTSIAQGNGGEININATGEVSYIGQGVTPVPAFGDEVVISGSFSQVQQDGVGNSGQVNITADSLRLIDKGAVLVDNSGAGGDAGDITLDIQNNIFLDQEGLILAQVQEGAVGNGGDINITAGSLEAQGDSFILADTKGIGNAGNINIDVERTFSISDGTRILTEVQENAVGNAGDINLTANSVIIKNNSSIANQTKGQGDAGNISITANETISLLNNGEIRSLVETDATGNGGNISLTSRELNLTNRSQINADSVGQSPSEDDISTAGDINIDVTGDINLDNGNQIQSQVRDGGVGNAGNIAINVDGSLFSTKGNLILADSKAKGNGGSITIDAGNKIVLEGFQEQGFPSQIVAGLTREDAEGKGGTITIDAGELVLKDVAFISSNTVANSIGAAGNITINVDSLNLSENAFINVFTANDFDGGSVTINAQTLDLFSGGKILAATDGQGNAGNIDLNINGQVNIDNSVKSSADFVDFGPASQLLNDLQSEPSGIYANATENSTGKGGSVNIGKLPELPKAPKNFIISNGGQIIVSSKGEGSGGNIFLRSQALELDNKASISASTNFGQGGVITLQIAEDLTLKNNSQISAQAFNDANGGNLNIDARFIIASPSNGTGNDFVATADKGKGGDINLNAEQIFGLQERDAIDSNNNFIENNTNDIDASSDVDGLDGNVMINTSDLNPLQGATEFKTNIVEPEQTTAQACNADREAAAQNSFIVRGKGGVMPPPDSPLNSANITINGENVSFTSTIPQPIETSKGNIQPARGVQVTESGEVILTSYRTNNSGDRLPEIKLNCGA